MPLDLFNLGVLAIWPVWFAMLFWTLVSTGIAYTISQLTQTDLDVTNATPGDLDTTTTDEGTKYTIVFGTCWVENPVLAWWGDVQAVPVQDHYSVNKWGNNKRVYYTIGYKYSFGAHLILCQGVVDGVKQLKNGDYLVWPDKDDVGVLQADGATQAVIDEDDLFGGRSDGGGIVGTIDFQYGLTTQSQNAYLVSVLDSNISATRGVTAAILNQVYIGMSPYPKQWSFLLKRTDVLTDGTVQWYVATANIGGALNAVHILRECYTNTTWGFGKDTGLFDDVVWQAAADVLYTEGFGLSMKWENDSQTLKEFVDDVCRHIDAHVYREPETGRYVIKLIRDDYATASLTTYNDDDISAVYDFSRTTVHDSVNTYVLKYWDVETNSAVSITDHELALMDLQDAGGIEQELTYYGIVDGELAADVLARDELELTAFPATMRIKGNRKLSVLRPGDVFKLTWSPLNITERIVRVTSVDLGTLQDNTVTLKCVEDVFAMGPALTAEPIDTKWVAPGAEPENAEDVMLYETPFLDVYTELGDLTTALALDSHAGFMSVAASHAFKYVNSTWCRLAGYNYDVLVADSLVGDFYLDGDGHYVPNGALVGDLPVNADDVVVYLDDLDSQATLSYVDVGMYAVIGDEIFKVKSVVTVSSIAGVNLAHVTLARGCLDTVPAAHAGTTTATLGARVWFVDLTPKTQSGYTIPMSLGYRVTTEYTAGDQPGVKLLTRTSLGILAEADATAHYMAVMNDRQARPYPPGCVKVNGVSYPTTFTGDLTITWTHRDRTQQLGDLVEHDAASVGPETGTTYTVKIYDENNSLIHTEAGLTGTSYAYTEAQEIIDCGFGTSAQLNSQLRFTLKSVRSGFDSWQSYDLTISRA